MTEVRGQNTEGKKSIEHQTSNPPQSGLSASKVEWEKMQKPKWSVKVQYRVFETSEIKLRSGATSVLDVQR